MNPVELGRLRVSAVVERARDPRGPRGSYPTPRRKRSTGTEAGWPPHFPSTTRGASFNRSTPSWSRPPASPCWWTRAWATTRTAAAARLPHDADALPRRPERGRLSARVDRPRVLCTHLHVDHVGWNTRLDAGRWVPTFSRARYLFARREWEHWSSERDPDTQRIMTDSVKPVLDAGLEQLVEMDHKLTDEDLARAHAGATRPVTSAMRLRGREAEAVITGDLMHCPVQVAEPAGAATSTATSSRLAGPGAPSASATPTLGIGVLDTTSTIRPPGTHRAPGQRLPIRGRLSPPRAA